MSSKKQVTDSFKEIANIPKIEWCSIADGANPNMLFAIVVNSLKASLPDLIHECPYAVSCRWIALTDLFILLFF